MLMTRCHRNNPIWPLRYAHTTRSMSRSDHSAEWAFPADRLNDVQTMTLEIAARIVTRAKLQNLIL